MPTTLEPPVDVDPLESIPTIDDGECCHVLTTGAMRRRDHETECGAPYDCLPPGTCSVYTGQELCPDCRRPICPKCATRMGEGGYLGGIRRAA